MADISAFLGRVLSGGLQRTNRYRCKLDLTDLRITDPYLQEAIILLREGLLCRTTMTPSRTLETTTVNLAGGYEETYAVGTTYNNLDCTFLCPLLGDPGGPDHVATNPVLSLFHAWQNLIQDRGTGGADADMVLTFPKEYRLEQGMRLELFAGRDRRQHVSEAKTANESLYQIDTNLGGTQPGATLPQSSQLAEHLAIMRGGTARQLVNPLGITTAFDYFDVYPVTVSGTTVDWLTMDEMMEVAVTFSYTHWQKVKDETLNL